VEEGIMSWTTARACLLAAACWTVVAASLEAQTRLGPEPRKKRSAFVADTNDAMALYDWGVRQIDRDPAAAADAFYWAARINPAYAEPLYARRSAILLRDPGTMRALMGQSRRAPSKELRHLDSLQLRALSLNPFLFRRFDRAVLVAYIRAEAQRSGGAAAAEEGTALEFLIERYLQQGADVEMRAWMTYAQGNFQSALALYADALRGARDRPSLHIERGRIFAMRSDVDSAVAQFQLALTQLRAKEDRDLVVVYNSKAMVEHSIAALLESADDVEGAREAYGRALQEDLAFYPAHVRLGLLSLGARDTTIALSELETATELAGDEPWVRFSYGYALASAGRIDAALEQLNKAVELEPLYAMPHAVLGKLWEHRQDAVKAVASYEAFLARASQRDPQRARIVAALEDVKPFLPRE
jgi:tetratricopeptide (TPR) repeat protein